MTWEAKFVQNLSVIFMESLILLNDPFSSLTGNARECEEVQELPVHPDQAGVPQLPLPWHI